MNDNFNENGLAEWLRDKAPEFSCALAARTALRTTPILHDVLGEDAAARRTSIVLPCFRALGACAVGKLATICSSIRSFVTTTYGV